MNHRYLVLTELFLPTKGGTAVWASEVYKRLGGKQIHIVTAAVPGSEAVDSTHPNTIHRLPLNRTPWLRPESLPIYARLFLASFWLSLKHSFQAVHAFRALPEGLVAWTVGRIMRHSVVVYAHGEELTTWGNGRKFRAMRFALRRADRVIANSDFTHAELLKLGVDPTRITVIYPGVDTDRFRPGLPSDDLRELIGLQPNQRLVLSVGRLTRRKGFDMVIRALPQMAARGLEVRLAIVGVGEDMEYLRNLATGLGIDGKVFFFDNVSMDDLPRWYNACDVFAMPNRQIHGDNEGFGMVFLEAAACGKACIAGKAGGTGAAVSDGITGIRVDGCRLADIADALHLLLTDDRLRKAMGDAGLANVSEGSSWQAVAQKTSNITSTRAQSTP